MVARFDVYLVALDPTRVAVTFARKKGQVALDQIRTIDKSHLVRKLAEVDQATRIAIAAVLVEM